MRRSDYYAKEPAMALEHRVSTAARLRRRLAVNHSGRFRVLPNASSAAARRFRESSVSLVFVDGDHSYDGVLSDLLLYLPKIHPGGILSGHDFGNPMFPGVTRAVLDFVAAQALPLHLGPDSLWWTQIP